MLVKGYANPFRKVRSVNETTTGGYRSDNALAAEPSGDAGTATGASYFTLAPLSGGTIRSSMDIVPFGVGSDTNTFKMRILAWDMADDNGVGTTRIWFSRLLADLTCTLSVNVGIASKVMVTTERFCDTIAINGTGGNANVTVFINSPANDANASVIIDRQGAQIIEFQFDRDGSATSANAWVKEL